jgi:hypothetical protein
MSHRRPALVVLAWLAVVGFLLGRAADARAQAPSDAGSAQAVAIIRIDIAGDHPPGLSNEIDAAVIRALGQIGFSGMSYEKVQAAIEGKPGLADCVSPDCLRQLPAILGTNLFLRVRVEASSAIYSFELLFLVAEGQGGSIKERLTGTCPVCTSDEFIDRVADNTRELMEPFKPVPVVIDSKPAGAVITVDGRQVGKAPFSGTLAPGPHWVRASLPGHADAEQSFDVLAGKSSEPQRFELGLTAGKPDGGGGGGGVVDEGTGSAFGLWKWPTAAAAVAAIAVGGYWMSIDGKCVDEPATGLCPELYDTQGQGIIAIGAGVALGVAAGLMFWSDSGSSSGGGDAAAPADTAWIPDITPTRGGAVGTLRFRF